MTLLQARALLFDMDGTVLDSTRVVDRLWTDICHEYGINPDTVLPHIHGVRAIDSIQRFLPADLDHAAIAADLAIREQTELDGVVALPGARELLEALPPTGVAMVTSAHEALFHARMEAAGLPIPPVVITAESVSRGKPDPEGYLAAASRLGVSPADAIVAEDAPAGLAAAHAAGMRAIAIGTAGGPPSEGLPRLDNYRDVALSVAENGVISLRF
ncbi:MAG: HAD-IA family hydrolase [Mycetocola sp.]